MRVGLVTGDGILEFECLQLFLIKIDGGTNLLELGLELTQYPKT